MQISIVYNNRWRIWKEIAMKKPVKKYNEVNHELQAKNPEAEEMFYMCESIDAYVARPDHQDIKEAESKIS